VPERDALLAQMPGYVPSLGALVCLSAAAAREARAGNELML
jgi:hypothetical protein